MGLNYYAPLAHSVIRNITPSEAVHLNNPGILRSVLQANWITIDKQRLLCLLDQAKNTKKDSAIPVIEAFMYVK